MMTISIVTSLLLAAVASCFTPSSAFIPAFIPASSSFRFRRNKHNYGVVGHSNVDIMAQGSRTSRGGACLSLATLSLSSSSNDDWSGEVASNTEDGTIRGCSIGRVGESLTDWNVTIDGVEADLGKFSEAIYRKIITDAKKQRFQGFRPGTIPPHLEPTYRAFSMDECAREATMEALEQNNMRPFEDSRSQIEFVQISIPPPAKKGRKKKKKSGRKNKQKKEDADETVGPEILVEAEEPQWITFEGLECMKNAIDAGWKPGQSFSFVASNVKAQQLRDQASVEGATLLGSRGSAIDLNRIDLDAIDVQAE